MLDHEEEQIHAGTSGNLPPLSLGTTAWHQIAANHNLNTTKLSSATNHVSWLHSKQTEVPRTILVLVTHHSHDDEADNNEHGSQNVRLPFNHLMQLVAQQCVKCNSHHENFRACTMILILTAIKISSLILFLTIIYVETES
jgi:hypothetical protein